MKKELEGGPNVAGRVSGSFAEGLAIDGGLKYWT